MNRLADEISKLQDKLNDLLNNPIFDEVQNIIFMVETFITLIEEFKKLGFLDDVQDFNDFINAIIENMEEILVLYPNFDEYKEDFYKIGIALKYFIHPY